jgi:Domain of unknown function (DUF4351)
MTEQSSPRADQDSAWKTVLRQYFREAMEFFFPSIAKEIDWTKPILFLDTELQKITPDAEVGKRLADQLVKVQRKKGQELILLIHLEIQATPEKIFPERMFIYSVRIFEYFHQAPISLAILCDAKPTWRPSSYAFQTLGSSLRFEFTSIKLLDYQSQWLQLEHSQNPFAIVVMAHLKTQETKRRASDRKTWKITLVKRLYEAGYSRSDVLNLFNFVDWLMILPEGLKQAFWQELKTYEEERKMPYITSVEQIGYDRGMKVGEETGQRSLILRLLTRKVGSIPDRTLDCINHLSIAQLESLGEALLDFSSIADLAAWLENQG